MTFDASWEKIHQEMNWWAVPSPLFIRFFEDNYADQDPCNLTFLDLGCGTGAQTIYLANKGCNVIAVDGSVTAIEKCYKHLTEDERTRVKFEIEDVFNYHWQFGPEFDCILDVCTLQGMPLSEVDKLLGFFLLRLKKNGKIFSKMACEPYDKSTIRCDYTRLITIEEVKHLFREIYECHVHQVLERLFNGAEVCHFLIEAWVKGSPPIAKPTRLF